MAQELVLEKPRELEWSIMGIWNKELSLGREEWSTEPRSFIRASEMGGAYLDRWLKMKGEKPSNPYNERTLRKFQAGHIFEWVAGTVLRRAGLITKTQGNVKIPLDDGRLPVHGHYDFYVSQPKSWDEARAKIEELRKVIKLGVITVMVNCPHCAGQYEVRINLEDYGLDFPAQLDAISIKIIDYLQEKYPIIYGGSGETWAGMKPIIYEIKSVNSLVFWNRIDQLKAAYPHHRLQIYTYIKGAYTPKGRILYISKDDLTVCESGVFLDDLELEAAWLKDIKVMTAYYMTTTPPPREDDIVLNKYKQKYELNWHIRYSPYLTRITGKSREEWEAEAMSVVRKRNTLLKNAKEYSVELPSNLEEADWEMIEHQINRVKEKEKEEKKAERKRLKDLEKEVKKRAKEAEKKEDVVSIA